MCQYNVKMLKFALDEFDKFSSSLNNRPEK